MNFQFPATTQFDVLDHTLGGVSPPPTTPCASAMGQASDPVRRFDSRPSEGAMRSAVRALETRRKPCHPCSCWVRLEACAGADYGGIRRATPVR